MRKEMNQFMNPKEMHKYDDILEMPRHVSRSHPQMPVADRAAQFAPFAALSGHHEAVKEAARQTDTRIEIDESCKDTLDRKLQEIQKQPDRAVSVTYFIPDPKKPGGSYVTVNGRLRRIDSNGRRLILADGTCIPADNIIEIVVLSRQK